MTSSTSSLSYKSTTATNKWILRLVVLLGSLVWVRNFMTIVVKSSTTTSSTTINNANHQDGNKATTTTTFSSLPGNVDAFAVRASSLIDKQSKDDENEAILIPAAKQLPGKPPASPPLIFVSDEEIIRNNNNRAKTAKTKVNPDMATTINKKTNPAKTKVNPDIIASTNATTTTTTIETNNSQKKKGKKPASPTWYKKYVPQLTRLWNPRPPASWCIPEPESFTPWTLPHSRPTAMGMLYIKSHKASSSTCEGIALNIAHHVGQRLFDNMTTKSLSNHSSSLCMAYTRHEFANLRQHARRDSNKSMLWSFVRNPIYRDLSHVYHFQIGRMETFNASTTNKNGESQDSYPIQRWMETRIKGRQTRYLIPVKNSRAQLWPRQELAKPNKTGILKVLRDRIIDNYDFLGVTERMTESLAVMVLLWDLDPRDVVVLNSKRSGGYDDGGHNQTCTKIPKAVMTPQLETYFETRHPIWNADTLLYHAVNASLDLTIERLGKEHVQAVAQQIQAHQALAQQECIEEAIFPCSPNGTYQYDLAQTSCYVQDAGCGHACVDRVLYS